MKPLILLLLLGLAACGEAPVTLESLRVDWQIARQSGDTQEVGRARERIARKAAQARLDPALIFGQS